MEKEVKTQNAQISHMISVLEKRLNELKYALPMTNSPLSHFKEQQDKEENFLKRQITSPKSIGKFRTKPKPSSQVASAFGTIPTSSLLTYCYFDTTPVNQHVVVFLSQNSSPPK